MIIPNSPRRSRLVANNHIVCAWWLKIVIYMTCSRRTHMFLEIEFWEWKGNKHIPVFVVVNVPPIILQVVELLSSVLMNGAEAYASRMMLLLLQLSTSALKGSLPTQWLIVEWRAINDCFRLFEYLQGKKIFVADALSLHDIDILKIKQELSSKILSWSENSNICNINKKFQCILPWSSENKQKSR
jgi:hypothetical protein